MDRIILKETIIREAKKDLFDNVGRIFLSNFIETFNVTRQEILQTLKQAGYEYRLSPDDQILLIYFTSQQERLKDRVSALFREGIPIEGETEKKKE